MRYGSLGDQVRMKDHMVKAYGLIDKVSERERLFITGYYHSATGNPEKNVEIHEVLTRTYPRDPVFHNNLAIMYLRRGDLESALSETQAGMRTGPKIVQGYTIATGILMELGRYQEVKDVIQKAYSEGLDAAPLHSAALYLAFGEGDISAQQRELKWFTGKAEEPLALREQANDAAARGQLTRSVALFRRATELTTTRNAPGTPQLYDAEIALADALFGRCGVKLSPENPGAPIVEAICGNAKSAQAFIETQRNARRDLTSGPAAFVRGVALFRNEQWAEASAVFEDMIDRRVPNWGPEYPAALVGLARASARHGDAAKARKAYDAFFTLWKQADADIPLLVTANREYAALAN
jgi:tetratricopeptide (TPR) repeat protein